jgi:hypothetical protein
MPYQASQQAAFPDRTEITLCEAVTSVVYGKAFDPLRQPCEVDLDQIKLTGNEIAIAKELLERLQTAAYAGQLKFRGIKEGKDLLDGHEDIDPLYFSITRIFDWRRDMIVDPVHAAGEWHFVHLDRMQFLSLLNDGSTPVSQGENDDPRISRKTFRTGAAGRPSSKHLVERMARRRLDAGDFPETHREFSEQLAEQLKVEEPEAHPMTPKAIRNSLGHLWRQRPARPKS